MNRIVINEVDQTTNVVDSNLTDVVYIPGFSNASLDAGQPSATPRVPTLCTSVGEFYDYFGYSPATFVDAQEYPAAFSAEAVPAGVNMFEAGDVDPSYVYAIYLLRQGLPVMYERVNMVSDADSPSYDVTVKDMYEYLSKTCYQVDGTLADRGLSIKYLTSGGYPTYEYDKPISAATRSPGAVVLQMAKLCQFRGDCVALIDHTNNASRPLTGSTSVFSMINGQGGFPQGDDSDLFAAMFTPWANYAISEYNDSATMQLPGSFAYLLSLANSIRTNANFLAVAGVARGQVPLLGSLNTVQKLTNAVADGYQHSDSLQDYGTSINAITYINGYGYCIWGNRTLRVSKGNRTGTAMGYLNLRNMVSDIKKQAFSAAQSLLFEQNTDILWLNFKAEITPLLDQLVSGGGLSAYKIIKETTTNKTLLKATIRIYPIYAVDSFEISVVLSDEDVSTAE